VQGFVVSAVASCLHLFALTATFAAAEAAEYLQFTCSSHQAAVVFLPAPLLAVLTLAFLSPIHHVLK